MSVGPSVAVGSPRAETLPHLAAPPGGLTRAWMATLDAWIDAHLAEPLTLARLCAQAGVSARSLQQAFESQRGMPPLRHVALRRFAVAHQRLQQAQPQDTVTRIALDCGFDHMGRFALGYKRLFGVSPSQTLAQQRRRAATAPAERRLAA